MSKNNFNEVVVVHQALKYPAEFLEDYARPDSRWKARELKIRQTLLQDLVSKARSLVAANTHNEKVVAAKHIGSGI